MSKALQGRDKPCGLARVVRTGAVVAPRWGFADGLGGTHGGARKASLALGWLVVGLWPGALARSACSGPLVRGVGEVGVWWAFGLGRWRGWFVVGLWRVLVLGGGEDARSASLVCPA